MHVEIFNTQNNLFCKNCFFLGFDNVLFLTIFARHLLVTKALYLNRNAYLSREISL